MSKILEKWPYLARDPVVMTVPSASTAVRFSTFSLMLPYRTAVEPLIRKRRERERLGRKGSEDSNECRQAGT
jgi:hypothetical protein